MNGIEIPGGSPTVSPAALEAPNTAAGPGIDPLVTTWHNRIKEARKHWDKFHQRVRYNRKLVRGIDDQADPKTGKYNKHRANLIQSTMAVVLSKVYAKNPEMSGEPTNKSRSLRLFADTVSTVTQTMLEDAKLKKKAKATVRAAMTCSYGIVKVQYQRDMKTDPVVADRIQDTQDNIARIEGMLKQIEDGPDKINLESQRRELEEAIRSLEEQPEVVAAEGLVIDRVRTDRLLIDAAIEDIWEYEAAGYMGEMIPMRRSIAQGMFGDFDLSSATTYKPGDVGVDTAERRGMYSGLAGTTQDDPIILVYEVWSKQDNTIYTLVEGCTKQFARAPYTPENVGERWWPYFLLPFQSVDGEFVAQALPDLVERLQEEHNETRDKFAEVRKLIRPHYIVSGDVSDKQITSRLHPQLGEIVVVDTQGGKLDDFVKVATQLQIDPAVYDTTPIRTDWEQVSGLQDAARSVVMQPKTATEASISDQSLAARVSEFRDQIEDWLTEIAQYASELCLLNMTRQQVETIMGKPEPIEPTEAVASMLQTGMPPQPTPTYEWPESATPDTVFNLIMMKIRAGSTAAPNKLAMQESWSRALPLLEKMIGTIMQVDAMGGDSTPYRELVKETAARFDETIDVERFLPPKSVRPMLPGPQIPGAQPGMPTPGAPIPATTPTPLQ